MQRIPSLYFAPSGQIGRGVFTSAIIPEGSLIEICPVIIIPAHEVDIIHHTELHDYYFIWGEDDDQAAIALGYGSLYNHSYKPNANFTLNLDDLTIEIIAIKDIEAGEEITFNYHGDPDAEDEVWFDETGKRVKRIKVI